MKDAEVILKCVNGHDRCYLGEDERCQYCERRTLPPRDRRGRFTRPALLAFLLLAGQASAQQPHMTPQHQHGWYDPICCSQRDCKPVGCEQLTEERGGGVFDADSGKSFSRDQVLPSQDSRCHTCINQNSGLAICVYVQRGS